MPGELVEVDFKISGDEPYSRAFELMEHEARDLSEPLDEVADFLILTVGEQFLTEGARTGQKWHPLSPAYAKWKEQHYPGRPIMVRTGDARAAALDKKQAVVVSPHRMLYMVDSDYLGYHQTGAGHNPQRKIVDLGIADRRQIDRIFHEWVNHLRRGPLSRSRS